jgi:hypothetical protein
MGALPNERNLIRLAKSFLREHRPTRLSPVEIL